MTDTLNAWFNSFIEISHAVLGRLTELPVAYVTGLALVGVTMLFAALRFVRRRRGKPGPAWRTYFATMLVGFVVGAVFLLDRKLALLREDLGGLTYFVRSNSVAEAQAHQEQMTALRALSAGQKAPVTPAATPDTAQSAPPRPAAAIAAAHRLFDPATVDKGVGGIFGEFESAYSVLNRAMEFATLRALGRDPAACFIVAVDLTDPAIQIEITEKITEKTLTSEFGRARQCVVAINGEAGMSPSRSARLGRYTGLCVSKGQTVLDKNSYERPMLAFDRNNRARYLPRGTELETPTADMYNVLWGRDDLLKNGEHIRETSWRWSRRDPRTLMGIDEKGTRLVLMIVDGRQRGYSEGLGLPKCAAVMRLFGVHDAMRCDQGGSSAMYLKSIDKIVSRPSDGRERPTYTHFGIRFGD